MEEVQEAFTKMNLENSQKSYNTRSKVTPGLLFPKKDRQRRSILKCPEPLISEKRISKKTIRYGDVENSRPLESSRKEKTKGTPSKFRKSSTTTPSKKKNSATPSQKLKLIREGVLQPSVQNRTISKKNRRSELQVARDQLHVSSIPKSLSCREKEFDNIYTFVEGKILDQSSGCMYISGLPGSGKTATVTKVITSLQEQVEQQELPEFEFIDLNGMRLTQPQQAYVQIYRQLFNKTVSWQQAHTALEKRFTTPAPKRVLTVLLVDELDIICNRRQDVVYNLLDWPTKTHAKLVVLTIANTMDLPERLLLGKVTSRLGLTRLTFQPYSFKQLQEIVTDRLSGTDTFKSDAVQLVARKVAAVSGDARRALDICRRATEIAEDNNDSQIVNMTHVQQALTEMISNSKVMAIKSCSRIQQLFLKAVIAEVARTGIEQTIFLSVYTQLESICAFDGIKIPNPGQAQVICSKLGSFRLLICEHARNDFDQKILLNVSSDDVHFALTANFD